MGRRASGGGSTHGNKEMTRIQGLSITFLDNDGIAVKEVEMLCPSLLMPHAHEHRQTPKEDKKEEDLAVWKHSSAI